MIAIILSESYIKKDRKYRFKATTGSVELIFTKPINLVSLYQFHHKATGICGGGPHGWQLREPASYISIGL